MQVSCGAPRRSEVSPTQMLEIADTKIGTTVARRGESYVEQQVGAWWAQLLRDVAKATSISRRSAHVALICGVVV